MIQTAADEARYRGLVTTGAVSKAAYDQAKAAADGARALLSAAEAQLKVAQDEGDYSTLVADADGTVVETLAEPGQVVSTGQPVVKLAHAGPREAVINLPETLRPAVGSTAQASLYGGDTAWPARLRQLSDAADPSRGPTTPAMSWRANAAARRWATSRSISTAPQAAAARSPRRDHR